MSTPSALQRTVGRAPVAGPLGALGVAAAALLLVHAVDPNQPGHYPTCPFLAVTGLYCPGCGSLRALHALTQGHVSTAVGLNPLAMALLPVLAVIWVRWCGRTLRGRQRASLVHPGWLWALAAVVVVFGVVRNLPVGAALAP